MKSFARGIGACLVCLQWGSALFLIYVAVGGVLGYVMQGIAKHTLPPYDPTCVFGTIPGIIYSYCPASNHQLLWFYALGIPSVFNTAASLDTLDLIYGSDDLPSRIISFGIALLLFLAIFGPGVRLWWRRRKSVALIACLMIAVEIAALGGME